MKALVAALVFVAVFSIVGFGQTADSYTLKFYAAGATSPVQQQSFAASRVTCNATPIPVTPGPVVNPTTVAWDDPDNANRECSVTFASGDTLFSLPVGSYEGALTVTNLVGTSPESAHVPFQRLDPPGVRRNVRFRR